MSNCWRNGFRRPAQGHRRRRGGQVRRQCGDASGQRAGSIRRTGGAGTCAGARAGIDASQSTARPNQGQPEMISIMMLSPRAGSNFRSRLFAIRVCGMAFSLALLAASDARSQSSVQGVPNAMQGFSQNRDQPIQIEAASLEMRDKKKEATFTGNVKVIQGDTTMTSKVLVVFYEIDPSPRCGCARDRRCASYSAATQCEGRRAGQGRADPGRRPPVRAEPPRSSGWKPKAMWW